MKKQLKIFFILTIFLIPSNKINSTISDLLEQKKEIEPPIAQEAKSKPTKSNINLKILPKVTAPYLTKLPRKQVIGLTTTRRIITARKKDSGGASWPSSGSPSKSAKVSSVGSRHRGKIKNVHIEPESSKTRAELHVREPELWNIGDISSQEEQNSAKEAELWNVGDISSQEEQNSAKEADILKKEKSYETMIEQINKTNEKISAVFEKSGKSELSSVSDKLYELQQESSRLELKLRDQKEVYSVKLSKAKLMLSTLEYKLIQEQYKKEEYAFLRTAKNLVLATTRFAEAQLEYKKAKQKLDVGRIKGQVDIIEKVNGLLKVTLTYKTWVRIVALLQEEISSDDFLKELKNIFSYFNKVEFYGPRDVITASDISSLAYLINNHFSYYYYYFKQKVEDGQSLKITSYSGYEFGYWYDENPDEYHEVIGEKSYQVILENIKFLAELNLQAAEQKMIEMSTILENKEEQQQKFPTEKLRKELLELSIKQSQAQDEVLEAEAKLRESEASYLVSYWTQKFEIEEVKFAEKRADLIKTLANKIADKIDYLWKLTYQNDSTDLSLLKDILDDFNKAQMEFKEKTEHWNEVEEILNNKTTVWKEKRENLLLKRIRYLKQKKAYGEKLTAKSNIIEKYYGPIHSELKITITKETWKKWSLWFFASSSEEEFLSKIKKEMNSFEKVDYSGLFGSINDTNIGSLANLICKNFPFYKNLFRKLNVNQALKIISYTGYKDGYFNKQEPFLNEVITQKQISKQDREALEKEYFDSDLLNITPAEDEFKKADDEHFQAQEDFVIVEEEYYWAEEKFIAILLDLEIRLIQSQEQRKSIEEEDKAYKEVLEITQELDNKFKELAKELDKDTN